MKKQGSKKEQEVKKLTLKLVLNSLEAWHGISNEWKDLAYASDAELRRIIWREIELCNLLVNKDPRNLDRKQLLDWLKRRQGLM